VYAVLSTNSVIGFALDSNTGRLTPIPRSSLPAGSVANQIRVHPSGKYLYVSNENSLDVNGYQIDANGGLFPLPGSPFKTGVSGYDIAVDPAGMYAYVVSNANGSIAVLSVNQRTGALTSVTGSPFPLGVNLASVVVHPNGRFVYCADFDFGGQGWVHGIQYDPVLGHITGLPGSPWSSGGIVSPHWVAIDPVGENLYAANTHGNSVSGYRISQTGALTPIKGSPFTAGSQPYALTIDPAGLYTYEIDGVSRDIRSYTINPQTGVLTPVGPPLPANVGNSVIVIQPALVGCY
jgi:6-phosphogluconolactonase (cycloisomerase 2 family)